MLILPSLPRAVAIGALLLGTPARAAVEAGQVACNVGGRAGLIVGSSRPLSCTFAGPAGSEHYVGSVSNVGVDIGYLAGGQMLWNVVASTTYPGPGSLAGSYSGTTVSAAVGPGVGQRIDRRLQPLVSAPTDERRGPKRPRCFGRSRDDQSAIRALA
jgi:hypothetical protein